MDMNASNAYESLAANGIIDFDAEAYVNGTKPRYVGNPSGYVGLPFDQPLGYQNYGITGGSRLIGAPKSDVFVEKTGYHNSKKHSVEVPWQKVATGGVVAGLVLLIGSKVKSIFKPKKTAEVANEAKGLFARAKDKISSLFHNVEKTAETEVPKKVKKAKEVAETVKEEVKKKATTAKSKVKKAAVDPANASKIESLKNKASELFTKGKEWIAKLPKGVKIAGLGVAGLLGLYEIYKSVTTPKQQYPYQ